MPVIRSILGGDVYDSSRAAAKLSLVTGGQDLKFKNRILIELARRSPVYFVPVGHPVNKNVGVVCALAQDGRAVVVSFGKVSIDPHTRDKLQQIEKIASFERHKFHVRRQNRAPSGGRAR